MKEIFRQRVDYACRSGNQFLGKNEWKWRNYVAKWRKVLSFYFPKCLSIATRRRKLEIIRFYHGRPLDHDNLATGLKPVVDFFKKSWIMDDDELNCEIVIEQYKVVSKVLKTSLRVDQLDYLEIALFEPD